MEVVRKKPVSAPVQLIAGFVVPTVVLMTLSDESRLGPLWAMGLALAPPVLLELYCLATGRKSSLLSVAAIVGVLLIGGIALLGLSEEWLALRRSAIYALIAVGLVIVARYRPGVMWSGLGRLLDTDTLLSAAHRRGTERQVGQTVARGAYLLVTVLMVTAVWSFMLTIIFMTEPAGTSGFNAQYAQLRLISIPAVTVPLLVGVTATLMYVLGRFEKLTGLDADQLLRRKR